MFLVYLEHALRNLDSEPLTETFARPVGFAVQRSHLTAVRSSGRNDEEATASKGSAMLHVDSFEPGNCVGVMF